MSDVKIFTHNIEDSALEQITTLVKQPAFSNCKIRIMPDVHAGAGCVIGFTADLGDKVIPNIVGVDIGCGMLTAELDRVDVDFKKLDSVIRDRVPAGKTVHNPDFCPVFNSTAANDLINRLHCKDQLRNRDWLECSMGTLGGGNHFIEIDEDDYGNKYLNIHTGSRNLGKQVADIYQKLAINTIYSDKKLRSELITKLKSEGREKDIQKEIEKLKYETSLRPPQQLCYLMDDDRERYLHDMRVCQKFAQLNRMLIAAAILGGMGWNGGCMFQTIHNYIDDENMVRKGAISAKDRERVLIPINMRDGCILGVGKGNPDWNYSAPHGAGRIMSRHEAREKVSMDEYKNAMNGIFTTSISEETIDESPMVYKSMDEIVNYIEPTVSIEKIIKPIYNFKGGE